MIFSIKKLTLKISICLLFILLVSACYAQNNTEDVTELHISAASSLTNALNEIKNEFEKNNAEIKIIYNFGASGTLSAQIKQGAPIDVFFSANKQYMDELVELGLIESNDIVNLLSNQIVFITKNDSDLYIDSLDELLNSEVISIAVGDPAIVPAGDYTKQLLNNSELWQELESKFIFTTNVRQALNYSDTGNVDAAFVYKSDALQSNQSKIIYITDQTKYDSISYPIGIINDTEKKKSAETFITFLQKEVSQNIFKEHGFLKLKK
ncbi:molybdate ABC transporter substrate-binding protein [Chengkuizengella sediminis]|uniref:molybdate ABC transporter substrate-binding protein n=1 Tax=Chengkuizengella sediminis TaxID=1885917 RepID=UPI0013896312|nr:molybdate ABC transporter substrate-binding protein [Chengkuizengella sediminis]NDI36725.1 molybdate ABC transporter substrate-binding protein [Chengkuizengella sediminis]